MHIFVDKETREYDGTQLSSLWALRTYNLQGDSIVTFRGPCRVELQNLVDIRDRLDQAPIFSPDMQHFIIEHFDTDLEKAVYRQRLLMAIIKDLIGTLTKAVLTRVGDDLYQGDRKLSVSIATVSPVSTLIHTGLNITTAGVPVPAVGLTDLGFDGERVWEFAQKVCYSYAGEVSSINLARCKVRGVD
jgi:hypothetical protein